MFPLYVNSFHSQRELIPIFVMLPCMKKTAPKVESEAGDQKMELILEMQNP